MYIGGNTHAGPPPLPPSLLLGLSFWLQCFASATQVTLVDFTVTQKGLEEQLLGRVIGKEQKALEEQLSDVLEEVNSNTKVPNLSNKQRRVADIQQRLASIRKKAYADPLFKLSPRCWATTTWE